jgi:hypothetical protein
MADAMTSGTMMVAGHALMLVAMRAGDALPLLKVVGGQGSRGLRG